MALSGVSQCSFFELDLPTDHFDIIVSQEILEHVDNQEAFAELCHQLLKKRGYLILTTPNATAFHRSGKFEEAVKNDSLQPVENLLTVTQLVRLFHKHFEIRSCRTIIRTGRKGMYRLWNSPKLNRFRLWEWAMDRCGIGLHTIMVGRAK